MARTVRLDALRDRVRQRADVETALHVTDAEVTSYINESIAALHSMIVEAGEDDFLTSADISTVAGTETYSLTTPAATFYKVEHVEVQIDGIWTPLERWQFSERHLYENSSNGGWGWQAGKIAYRIVGRDNLRILPAPDGVYTVRLWYHAASVLLSADSDTYDGRDGWEEWVVLDAAIKIGVKEESDVGALVGEREKVELRIKPQARTKDRARPARVGDVGRVARDPWGDIR